MAEIYYSRTCDRKAFVRKVLELFQEELAGKRKIFCKLNLVSHEGYPTTTHPEMVEALVEGLVGRELILGDAAAVDLTDPHAVLEQHELSQACRRLGVGWVDLYQTAQVERSSPRGYPLQLSSLPFACDYVISLPVLKVHFICDLTGALKNQFGYLSPGERLRMHYNPEFPQEMREGFLLLAEGLGVKLPLEAKDLHQGIAEVNVLAPPHLFIVDGVRTLLEANEKRHGGREAELGILLAGKDPVSLDCYGLKLLQSLEPRLRGRGPEEIGYLRLAMEYGLGSPDYELVEI